MARKTHEVFIEEMKSINPSIEILNNYIKQTIKVSCKCKICGHLWEAMPSNLLRGYGCYVCGKRTSSDKQRKSHEQFVQEINKIHPSINIIGQYIGAQSPVDCKCTICGYEWSPLATNLLSGKGCPICKRLIAGEKRTKTHGQFAAELQKIKPNVTLLGKYVDNNTDIFCHCNICNYEWYSSPSTLIHGKYACPRCAKNERYTDETFKEKLRKINPYIETLEPYVNNRTAILCKCLICGYERKSRPNNLLNGKGCPSCCHTNSSFFEQVIFGVFSLAFPALEWRNRSLIGKELDIYIPEAKIAIEPGSWRWHKNTLLRDKEKRRLCKEKGVKLITVYTDFDGNEMPLEDNCIVTHADLGLLNNVSELKKVIGNLLALCNIKIDISQDLWNNILQEAYKKARRMSTEEFVEKVKHKLPNVTIKGEYKGTLNPIECQCNQCGKIWSPIANSLLRGHGCNDCKYKTISFQLTKTHDQFIKELSIINPNISIIDIYQKSDIKVTCQCKICGNKWTAFPSNLLRGRGCSQCAKEKRKKDYKL